MAIPFPDIPREVFEIPAFSLGAVTLGPFGVRWYALAYIVGILLGWRYAASIIDRPDLWGDKGPPITKPLLEDLVAWVTLGLILGGRIGYVLFYMLPLASGREILANDPMEILRVWHGGMSFHGGFLGFAAALSIFAYRHRIALFRLGDLMAAAAPIAIALVRIANFINGELWGRPTSLPWGMEFCGRNIDTNPDGSCIAGHITRHPSQLYEATLEGLVLFLGLRFITHRRFGLQRPGLAMGVFLLGYGLARIALENVRMPDAGLQNLPYGLTVGMILSTPMLIAGAWLTWRATRPAKPADAAQPL